MPYPANPRPPTIVTISVALAVLSPPYHSGSRFESRTARHADQMTSTPPKANHLVATSAAPVMIIIKATEVIAGPRRWTFIGVSSSGSPTNRAAQMHLSAPQTSDVPQQGQSIVWVLLS